MRQQVPGVRVYAQGDSISRVYGRELAHGTTPVASAAAFLKARSAVFGVEPDELELRNVGAGASAPTGAAGAPAAASAQGSQGVMFESDSGRYKFSLVRYRQVRAGLEVHGATLDVLVRNDMGNPVVMVGSALRPLGDFAPAMPSTPFGTSPTRQTITRDFLATDFKGEAIQGTGVVLTTFSTPEPVIWAGSAVAPEAPRVALRYVADNSQDASATQPEKWLIVADAQSGDVLLKESLIVFDVDGSVAGRATEGPKAMQCSPETAVPFPYAQVNITGGSSAYADGAGDFSIPHAGTDPVNVTSAMGGDFFDVNNLGGSNEVLTLSVTPPGPADFLHDADATNELVIAQANGYANANEVRDWVLSHHPSYPVVANELNFPVNVNRTDGYCPGNAWYDYSSINFCRSTASYGNTSFASVSQHEYGHHLVSSGGSGQGAYGEGMSDVIAMLIADDPGLGYGFYYGQCDSPLRSADNTCQYSAGSCSSCGSEAHACGMLISGAVWDVRDALLVTEPADYLDIVSALAVNSILLHAGTLITPTIAIDFLTLDDDDGNLDNGTPHRTEICAGFDAHGLTCPELTNYFTVTVPAEATEADGVLSGQGSVSLFLTSPSDETVSLTSSDPNSVAVPASVVIPAGTTSVSFDLDIGDDLLLDGTQPVTITASGGLPADQGIIQVHDDETALLTVSLPAAATEGDGVLVGAGVVTVDQPVDADVVVLLSSDDPNEVTTPASVTVPSGTTGATFDLTIVDDGEIDGIRSASVSARVVGWTAGSAAIEVADNESTQLIVTLPSSIGEGDGTLVGAGSVTLSGTLASDLLVSLASGDAALLGVPATTTVAAGSTTASFDLLPVDDTVADGTRSVLVNASAAGFADGAATLDILDDDAASLRVTLLDGTPARAGAGLTVRVEALDGAGTLLPAYAKAVDVSAEGAAGTLPTTPSTVIPSGGVFEGPISIDGVSDGVVLSFSDAEGATGSSPAFDVLSGPLDGFTVVPGAGPQIVGLPFDLTVTAVDDNGFPVSGFAGPANMRVLSEVGGGGSGPVQILSFTGYVSSQYANTLGAISTHYPDYVETATNVTDASALAALLADKDVFLIPAQTNASASIMQNLGALWAGVLSDFVNNGGTVIACSLFNYEHTILAAAGLMTLTPVTAVPTGEVVQALPTHPLAAGTPASFTGLYMRTFSVAEADADVVFTYAGNGNVIARDVGRGHAVMVATDFTYVATPMDRVIANAVEWSLAGRADPVASSPATTGSFVDGVWSGALTVHEAVTGALILVDDGAGHSGTSSPIDVEYLDTLTVSVPGGSESEGTTLTGSVSLSAAAVADVVVTLVSNDVSEITVPSSVTIAAGTSSASFALTLVDDALLDGTRSVEISATAVSYGPGSASVAVLDNEIANLQLSLPLDVTEGDGVVGGGHITVDMFVESDTTVALNSDDPNELAVDAEVTISAGASSASFNLSVIDDLDIDGDQIVGVSASAFGETATGTVTVVDNESTQLTVTLPSSIGEGDGTLAGAGQVTLSGTLASDLVVTLSSTNPTLLAVPATTTVAAGATSASFDLTPVDDSVADGTQSAIVVATADGFNVGAAPVDILDDDAASLRVTLLDPTPVRAGAGLVVRVEAIDALGAVLPAYAKAVDVSAVGNGGALPTTPTVLAPSGGVFEGPISIDGAGDAVVLSFSDAAGATGASAAFDVVTGPLDGFTVSPVASPQIADVPFAVTVTAVDDSGYPVESYTGPADLQVLSDAAGSGSGGAGSGPVRILSFIAYANNEYANTLNAISAHYPDYVEASTTVTDPSALAALLADNDVFLIPEQETASQPIMQNLGALWAPVLSDFVHNGGTVITCTLVNYEHLILSAAGLMTLTPVTAVASVVVQQALPAHPLAAGTPSSFTGQYVRSFVVAEPDAEVVFTFNGNANVIARDVGRGHVVMVGSDFTYLATPMDRVIANAVEWSLTGRAEPVASSPATTGTFAGGVWSGELAVHEAVTGGYIQVDDGAGHYGASSPFDVEYLDTLTLSVPGGSASEGTTLAASVALGAPAGADLTVELVSSDTSEATVPTSVTIAAGTVSASFLVTLVDDALLDGTQSVQIDASATSYGAASASVSVLDDELPDLQLSLPTQVTESDGVLSAAGSVSLGATVELDTQVTLTSDDPNDLGVPAEVTVAAGTSSAEFDLSVFDNGEIDGDRVVGISASALGDAASAAVTVLDDEDLTLSVVAPSPAIEGASNALQVFTSGAVAVDLEITLDSSDPGDIILPTTATIVAGQSSVSVSYGVVDDSVSEDPRSVTIGASAPGFVAGSAVVTLLDDDPDHFDWAVVPGPVTVGEPVAVTIYARSPSGGPSSYDGTLLLAAGGAGGPVPISPAVAGPFSLGSWSGDVVLSNIDTGVQLEATDGAGHGGLSNAFDVVAGPVDRFAVSALPPTLTQNAAEPVTVTAVDSNGFVSTGFNGSASLEVLAPSGSATVQILSFTRYANNEYPNTLAAISTYFTDYVETSTTATDPLTLATLLVGKDVFLIPEQETGSLAAMQALGDSWATLLNGFVTQGGTVVACSNGTYEHEILTRAGVLGLSPLAAPSSGTVVKSLDHPLSEGIANSFVGSYLRTYSVLDPDAQVPFTVNGQANVISRELGSGRAIMIGTDFFSTGTAMNRVIANAIEWAQGPLDLPVPSSPATTGAFVDGVWTGSFQVHAQASAAYLRVDDGAGHIGASTPFDVVGAVDSDGDGLDDALEALGCTDALDADSDDDGLDDGVEDADQDGALGAGETDPCSADTDADQLQDGTEVGVTLADVGPDTDLLAFVPDLDPASTTDPLNADTDGDGVEDGTEDADRDGMVGEGETDPRVVNTPSDLSVVQDGWLAISASWNTLAPTSRLYRAASCDGVYALVYEGAAAALDASVPAPCTTYFYRASALNASAEESAWTDCVAVDSLCCDDGIFCTADSWDGSACQNAPNNALCDDDLYCTGVEVCDVALGCQLGTAPSCDDSDVCTDDACDPGSDACVHTHNSASCEDGDACTGGDVCVAGVCTGQVDMCAETDLFFDDFASGLAQWTETGEGDWNTESLHSSSGYPGSASGSPAAHSDNCDSSCTLEIAAAVDLSPYASATLSFLRFVDVGLDSGEYLKVDAWDGTSWVELFYWTHGAGDTDQWHAEVVDLAPYMGVSDFSVRFVTRSSYTSEHVQVDDVRIVAAGVSGPECASDVDCDDDLYCNGYEICVDGTCVDGAPPDCDDGNACTDDTCHDAFGCQYSDNTALCDDGEVCTTGDACAGGSCQPGAPLDCDDSNVCTEEMCVSGVGCVFTDNDVPCDDGNACTGDDICSGGVCAGPIDLCPEPDELLFDDFASGLGQWTETGEGDWNTETLHSSSGYPGGGSGSPAAHADNCDTQCTLTLATPLDLSGRSQAKLELLSFIDSSLDDGEYLRVEAFDGSSWNTLLYWTNGEGDTNQWGAYSVDLAGYLGTPNFSIRFVTSMNSYLEHVHVDDVRVLAQ